MLTQIKTNVSSVIKKSLMFVAGGFYFLVGSVFADPQASIGAIASNITTAFNPLGKLMIGTSYVAGIGFAIAAIFKFKQHRDNPTQIPMGTPIALLVIAIALVFLPDFFAPAGQTLYGGSDAGGFTGGGVTAIPGAS